eukprot:403369545
MDQSNYMYEPNYVNWKDSQPSGNVRQSSISEGFRYLDSYQRDFDRLVTEALTTEQVYAQQESLAQAFQILKEVESIINRKQQAQQFLDQKNSQIQNSRTQPNTSQSSQSQRQDINFMNDNILLKLEKISEQTNNILVQYYILRIFDIIMKNKLMTYENKETGNLIYFINNIFLIHDILVGSTIANRMVQRSKFLLNYVLKRQDINEDQEEEIKELLSLPNLKGSEIINDVITYSYIDIPLQFDNQTSEIKRIARSQNIQEKLQALTQLIDKLTACQNLQEQLQLFSSKCQPIVKSLIRDVKESDQEVFNALSNFLTSLIFETDYLVELDRDILGGSQGQTQPISSPNKDSNKVIKLFQLTEQKEVLENSEGLYTSVALIINFFLSFPKRIQLQSTVLTVFKRLYNTFSIFRKNLEDPIIMVLINIQYKHIELQQLKSYQNRSQAVSSDKENDDAKIEESYAEAQTFVNYLINSDDTESSFKEKLFSRKELQNYLTANNLESFKPNPRCLQVQKYGEFNLKVAYPQIQEIAAGAQFFQMIEVEDANSIIFCGFSTTNYDIKFGFYKVTSNSQVSNEDEIQHQNLEEIFQLTQIESFPNFVKVSFIAKEPGIYKVLWSNDHSWFKGKTLAYRISVLKQVEEESLDSLNNTGFQSNKSTGESTNEFENLQAIKKENTISFQQKIQKVNRKHLSQIIGYPEGIFNNYTKKAKGQRQSQGDKIELFIQIDLDYDQIKISQQDVATEVQNELAQTDDLAFILDENIQQYFEQLKLEKPSQKNHLLLFITLSKQEKATTLIKAFKHNQIKYIQDASYDITVAHDCDVGVFQMVLGLSENFQSSLCMKNQLVQDSEFTQENDKQSVNYSYEVGDFGLIKVIIEQNQNIDHVESHSGDETQHQENSSRKLSLSSHKQYVLKEVRDTWRDPKAMAIALTNLNKLSGLRINAVIALSGFEDESQKIKMNEYIQLVKDQLKEMCSDDNLDEKFCLELRQEEYIIYGMKHVYQYLHSNE